MNVQFSEVAGDSYEAAEEKRRESGFNRIWNPSCSIGIAGRGVRACDALSSWTWDHAKTL